MPQGRLWCFTLNNPVEEALPAIIEEAATSLQDMFRPHVTYMVFQLEQGENGTPHFQVLSPSLSFSLSSFRGLYAFVRRKDCPLCAALPRPDGLHIGRSPAQLHLTTSTTAPSPTMTVSVTTAPLPSPVLPALGH